MSEVMDEREVADLVPLFVIMLMLVMQRPYKYANKVLRTIRN